MVFFSYHLERDEAELYSLILNSAGIGNRIVAGNDGFMLQIPSALEKKARETLLAYHEENPVVQSDAIGTDGRDTDRSEKKSSRQTRAHLSGICVALLLLVVHIAVTTSSAPQDYTKVFGADAIRILNGELYRSVTALLLHADAMHLAGNMVGLVLFGGAVSAVAGTGVGWLAILVCGMFGNYLNAYAYETGHLSIGASTSVFGAVGLLSAFQAVKAIQTGHGWKQAGLALGGGLGLLAFLGTSARSDLGAHLFGFVVGGLLGAVYGKWMSAKTVPRLQWLSGIVAAALVVGAWVRGAMG